MVGTSHGLDGRAQPRIVLTKARVSVAITLLYALATLVAVQTFASMAERQSQVDGRVGQVSVMFAALMATFWLGSLVMIHRRPS